MSFFSDVNGLHNAKHFPTDWSSEIIIYTTGHVNHHNYLK